MRKFFRKLLDIDESEEGRVYMLLANSFFLGVFVVTYDVTVSSLFLDSLSEIEKHSKDPTFHGAWIWKDIIYRYPLALSIILTGFLG
ncbi:MAG TPA: hypothetical protein VNW06_07805, partial [Cytophagaceae bacterium]|nr:hypothetical protein [Cytophagaceae bacterium]